MTSQPFRCAAILGLGLMGASLGMALRASGCVQVVAGYDAAAGVAERAHARGAIDRACPSLAEAVAGADLVVLAVPVLAMRELLESLAARSPQLATDALVTDLGSTKAQVVAWAEELLPAPERFVGGHPMAGSEEAGIEAAEQGLLRGCVWCLTPTARTSQATLHRMQELVTTLGAHPVLLAASQHDAAVAAVSHLPLLAASALVITASQSPAWAEGRMLAAGGFRDSTRVASGNPRMARDICLTNAQPLVACLDAYIATLQTMRERLLAGDAAIEETFRDAKQTRDSWIASSG